MSAIPSIEDPTGTLKPDEVYVQSRGQVFTGNVTLTSPAGRDGCTRRLRAVDVLAIPAAAEMQRQDSSILVLPRGGEVRPGQAYLVQTEADAAAAKVEKGEKQPPVTCSAGATLSDAESHPVVVATPIDNAFLEPEAAQVRRAAACLLAFSVMRITNLDGMLGLFSAASLLCFAPPGPWGLLQRAKLARRVAVATAVIGALTLLVIVILATSAVPTFSKHVEDACLDVAATEAHEHSHHDPALVPSPTPASFAGFDFDLHVGTDSDSGTEPRLQPPYLAYMYDWDADVDSADADAPASSHVSVAALFVRLPSIGRRALEASAVGAHKAVRLLLHRDEADDDDHGDHSHRSHLSAAECERAARSIKTVGAVLLLGLMTVELGLILSAVYTAQAVSQMLDKARQSESSMM